MDRVVPFATETHLSDPHFSAMEDELMSLTQRLQELQEMSENHYGLQDRLQNTGILTAEQVQALGVVGLAAKASGIDRDIRRLFSPEPYEPHWITVADEARGDVAARTKIRFKECF